MTSTVDLPFSEILLNLSEKIFNITFMHPIISSLNGSNNILSKDTLLKVRDNFFIQDYYYLVYAHKVPKFLLVDSTKKDELRKKILRLREPYERQRHNPIQLQCNPFIPEATLLINLILHLLATVSHITMSDIQPNSIISEYIQFKIKCALEGEAETIVSNLPCLYIFSIL